MKYLKAIWQFVSYLFWPQKTDKTRYDNQGKYGNTGVT